VIALKHPKNHHAELQMINNLATVTVELVMSYVTFLDIILNVAVPLIWIINYVIAVKHPKNHHAELQMIKNLATVAVELVMIYVKAAPW